MRNRMLPFVRRVFSIMLGIFLDYLVPSVSRYIILFKQLWKIATQVIECIILDVAHTIPIFVNLYSQIYPLAERVVLHVVRVNLYRCHNPEEKTTIS
jgi:phage-related protein